MTVDRDMPNCILRAPQRCGALLMELIAAMALFGVVLTIAVPVVTSVSSVREESRRRQLAQVELGNLMEQVAARHRAGDSIIEFAPALPLTVEAAASLPDARLTIEATPQNDAVPSILVTARLRWTTASGRTSAPAELSACFTERVSKEAAP